MDWINRSFQGIKRRKGGRQEWGRKEGKKEEEGEEGRDRKGKEKGSEKGKGGKIGFGRVSILMEWFIF